MPPDLAGTGNMNSLTGFKIHTRIIHGGADAHRRGGKLLHLFHLHPVISQPITQHHGIFHRRAGMPDDDVGDDLAFEAGLFAGLEELAGKLLKAARIRLSHQAQNGWDAVLRGKFEPAAGVFGGQGGNVGGAAQSQVVPDPGGNENVIDLRQSLQLIQQFQLFLMRGLEPGADLWIKAGWAFAAVGPVKLTAGGIHIGRGTAHIAEGDGSFSARGEGFGLIDDGIRGTRPDRPSLVGGDGAEIATAVTTAVGSERIPDLLESGDLVLAVTCMGRVFKGQVVESDQLL